MAKTKDNQLDSTAARYEERLVELHSVIAELSRLVGSCWVSNPLLVNHKWSISWDSHHQYFVSKAFKIVSKRDYVSPTKLKIISFFQF